MKFILLLALLLTSSLLWAHEVTVSGSYLKMQKQNKSGRQVGVDGHVDLNDSQRLHLGGQYLERFDLFERLALVGFEQKFENYYLKFDAEFGHNGRILPHHRYSVGSGQSLFEGISLYEEFRTAQYTKTQLNEFIFNIEIEKIPSIVLIPTIRLGNAHFTGPNGTQKTFTYGLKVLYYREDVGQAWISLSKGQEPAQAVLGSFNEVLRSKTAAVGGKYIWNSSLSSGLSFEYTDYDLIKNQFVTTTLTTTWSW